MEHLFCPQCWAVVFGLLACLPFIKAWALKWRDRLLAKHAGNCKKDSCHHDHDGSK
jgi:hypothetical protein